MATSMIVFVRDCCIVAFTFVTSVSVSGEVKLPALFGCVFGHFNSFFSSFSNGLRHCSVALSSNDESEESDGGSCCDRVSCVFCNVDACGVRV